MGQVRGDDSRVWGHGPGGTRQGRTQRGTVDGHPDHGLARPKALDGCGREGGGEGSANGVDGEGRRHVYFLEFQYY